MHGWGCNEPDCHWLNTNQQTIGVSVLANVLRGSWDGKIESGTSWSWWLSARCFGRGRGQDNLNDRILIMSGGHPDHGGRVG